MCVELNSLFLEGTTQGRVSGQDVVQTARKSTQRFSLQALENFIELHSQNKCNQFRKLNELSGDTVATIQHGIGVIVSVHKLALCKSSFTAL